MRMFIAVAIVTAFSQLSVADVLLVEIQDDTGTFDSPGVGGTLRVWPTVDGVDGTTFANGYGLGDTIPIGETFAADAAILDAMEGCLVTSPCSMQFVTGPNISHAFQFHVDDLWDSEYDWRGLDVQTFVPQLGPGFSGYDLTAITRTIDDGWLTYDGRYYYGYIAQTVRFSGTPIPEPATLAFVVMSHISVLGWRGRRSPIPIS